MPVGTRGSVQYVGSDELAGLGADMVLANTYHLWVRPGHELVKRLGGLHTFMNWDRPILTDSGGYQVFSMKDRVKLTEEGVRFRSPLDGEYRFLSPELAIEIQEALGVDVAMVLDECLEWPATRERTIASTERTTRWLKRCLVARQHADRTAVFGIVQGGTYPDLRAAHAQEIGELDLDGFAVGGLSVGEGHDIMMGMVDASVPSLPTDRPRYLMGVGHPNDIVQAVRRGIDLFDCVLPTRHGRHGQIYTTEGKRNLKNGRYREDPRPIDPGLPGSPASGYSRAYLVHLMKAGEPLGKRLLTLHNLYFYQWMMGELRTAIQAGDQGRFDDLAALAERASRPADD